KSCGPDGISAFLLNCAEELTPAWCPIFQQSLDTQTVYSNCSRSVIIPVPKKAHPTENNDFRAVALTSVVMKCFEKCVVAMLKEDVNSRLDPLQFAYRQRRSTGDAINSTVHLVLKHLEDPRVYARMLFIDFSSANSAFYFNSEVKTIEGKLLNHQMVSLFLKQNSEGQSER
ncbi:hypothetical protein LDENG_00182510, partial [Lucifuga dentata]